MALFESYERREKQILAVLKEYGIDSIEGAAEVTKAAGLDVYREKGCSRRCQIGKILCRDRNSEKFQSGYDEPVFGGDDTFRYYILYQ